jgi:chorismate synthase
MSGTWGKNIRLSIFGESHGPGIGIEVDGLPPGFPLDLDLVAVDMERRAGGRDGLSTPRKEKDSPEIMSGLFEGRTTGTPLLALFRNADVRSADYASLRDKPRPGHADFAGRARYLGFNDPRGSGHFSGRITTGLVFAGAVAKQLLRARGVTLGAHAFSVGPERDLPFDPVAVDAKVLASLAGQSLPTLDREAGERMKAAIEKASAAGDSIGGVIETAVVGLEAGIGSPFFDSLESTLAHLLFSVPAVKGLEFGAGFALAGLTGSEANDPFVFAPDGSVRTTSNHAGGINGGISNGMPVLFRVVIKPTSSIARVQKTIDLAEKTEAELSVSGRHDPCIVRRALPVIEAVTAVGILDLMMDRAAWSPWMGEKR